ncbi:DUF4389 domain-containing protein [Streptomyces alkaliphilus]|uniref:DUF4389 domain-containing protein n=1 Tax=Streptomyces alkaliphilus TaxID=1472722 RepID=UPI00117E7556|nr:DUF4389 domain-containing protein [Streptomyces alkaliphilus]MQS09271.1 DUF4389 domain-containing protein [Streptomyces alkaliphilus]
MQATAKNPPAFPVRVEADPDEPLSRWLWLVKWLLLIPHYFLLAFLWTAFVVVTVIAFFAILFTARYPRPLFDFNLGVLRWTWRVAYYTTGAFATDRYPPFSLGVRPEYPARLTIEFPEQLSRGLVLVKWWLLAIPHYLVVGILTAPPSGGEQFSPPGLITLLAFFAIIAVTFTAVYPRGLFDLMIGLNRWVLRVAAYVALMTDAHPPYRLDQGPREPGPEEPTTLPGPGNEMGEASGVTDRRSPGAG